ncbi:MAG: putative diheme cytochrome c-553 [Myxococcales bacterium]|nr:putative diheme cytochrome c-553 [Myxococcales bacterium]
MRLRSFVVGGLVGAVVLASAGAALAKGSKEAGKEGKGKEDPVARGGYLVSFSGCNDCHTPWVFNKDLGMPVPDMTRMLSGHPVGAPEPTAKLDPKTDLAFIGATFTAFKLPFGVVYSANLTPDKETGLGNWTEEMFIKAVRTGMHLGAAGRPILPPMPWPEFRNMTDDDLKAVFAFLKSIPAIHNPVADPKVPPPVIDGLMKTHPKMLEMLDAHAHHGAPPAAPPSK